MSSSGRLYKTVLTICLTGFVYLFVSYFFFSGRSPETVCVFKNLTGYPCSGCGTTRAVFLLLDGCFAESLLLNPLGFLCCVLFIGLLGGACYDRFLKKQSFYRGYLAFEEFLKQKWVIALLILLTLTNWGWNLSKNL